MEEPFDSYLRASNAMNQNNYDRFRLKCIEENRPLATSSTFTSKCPWGV